MKKQKKKTNFIFKEFDVIRIQKLHANNIFKEIKKGNKNVDFTNSDFLKERPAIILKTFWTAYIVVPLTTKIIKNNKIQSMVRSELINPDFKKTSYLMFDSIMQLHNYQILGLYKNKGKPILFSNSTKKWLKQEACDKYANLFGQNQSLEAGKLLDNSSLVEDSTLLLGETKLEEKENA